MCTSWKKTPPASQQVRVLKAVCSTTTTTHWTLQPPRPTLPQKPTESIHLPIANPHSKMNSSMSTSTSWKRCVTGLPDKLSQSLRSKPQGTSYPFTFHLSLSSQSTAKSPIGSHSTLLPPTGLCNLQDPLTTNPLNPSTSPWPTIPHKINSP